jgi:hypothetical protein
MADRPPPPDVAQFLLDGLDRQDPDELRTIATYAEKLATWKEPEAESEDKEDAEPEVESDREIPEDLPDDVPAKASIVIKEINDNRYYYWQWREGDKVTSKYKGPVSPSE